MQSVIYKFKIKHEHSNAFCKLPVHLHFLNYKIRCRNILFFKCQLKPEKELTGNPSLKEISQIHTHEF